MGNKTFTSAHRHVIVRVEEGRAVCPICGARTQLPHFLTATVDRNTFITDHGCNITAVLTNQKFLFHFISLPVKSVSRKRSIMHQNSGHTIRKRK